jgi:uridine kinase
MPAQTMTYPALARRVRALPPSCGPVRVVAVDGPSGAGKSTLADRLADALGHAPVVASDHFPVPWDGDPLAWWQPVVDHVLTPLAAHRPGGYRPYDWHRGAYLARIEIPVTPVLIVEGVGAAWREAPAAYRIWVDAPADVRRTRVLDRDGGAVAPAWDRWRAREREHFAADRTQDRADLHLDGAPAIPLDPRREFALLPVPPPPPR